MNFDRIGDDLGKACVEGYQKGLEEGYQKVLEEGYKKVLEEGYKKVLEEGYKKVLEEQVPVDLGAQSGRAFKRIDKDSWGK